MPDINMKNNAQNKRGISRRKFVVQGASTLTAFTIIPRHVLGGTHFTAPSDKLNIACVGVGGKGRVDVEGVSSENIIALCDVDQKRATAVNNYERFPKHAYDAFPKARRYKDFREMLEKEKDIDAVTISTPDHTHAIITMMVMKMGKHVYTQKPLTRTIFEAREITKTARETGVATQMGNQGHANPGPRILNELIWQGAIGMVREVHCWTDRPVWPQGTAYRPKDTPKVPATLDWDLWLGPAPYRSYHPAYVPFGWRGWWDFGCGALGDMGCHVLDYPFWALKLSHPASVEAFSTGIFEETAPHASMITYTFERGEGLSPVDVIWYDGGLRPTRPEGLKSELELWEKGSGVLFRGDQGILVYGHHRSKPVLLINGKEENYEMPKEIIPRSPGHYKEWIEACKGGKPSMSNFEYAGPLTELVLLGNVALRTGNQKLNWDMEHMKVTNLPEANPYLHDDYRKGWTL
jgi:predicted dehydrogenase